MDIVTINSEALKIWQDENLEYLRYEYDLKPGEKCLDIGSYQKEWAAKMIEKFKVEVECFDALDNKAAWIFNGYMFFGGAYYYTSIYGEGNPVRLRCLDIADYLQEEIAVCKINIEGGEYELLNHIIEQGLMKNIKNIQVQFHLIRGADCEKSYENLAKRISETHTLTWRYPFVWENWKRND